MPLFLFLLINMKHNLSFSDPNQSGTSGTKNIEKIEIDHRFAGIDKFMKEFPWLYYQLVEKEFKCKVCEIFPALSCGKRKHLFGQVAVKTLTDHPRCTILQHQNGKNHKRSEKEYQSRLLHLSS